MSLLLTNSLVSTFTAEEKKTRPGHVPGSLNLSINALTDPATGALADGKDDVAIHDGVRTEWGLPGDTPVDTGSKRADDR